MKIDASLIGEIQRAGIEMLDFFKAYCDAHSLQFWLCGGCCIGAARRGGFIEWDDDVDVFMPREDYRRLLEHFNAENGESRYFLQFSTKEKPTKNQFATLCDSETTFIKSFQKELDINHGLALDILPLDGCPHGASRRLQKLFALLYSLYIIGESPKNNGALIRLGGTVLLLLVPLKSWRYRLWCFCEKQMTKYKIADCDCVTELCAGIGYMQNEYPASAFDGAAYLDFEGRKMPCPADYDCYLRTAFGDYMNPPPENERECHHQAEFIDMNNSYQIYKGKYYCVNGGK